MSTRTNRTTENRAISNRPTETASNQQRPVAPRVERNGSEAVDYVDNVVDSAFVPNSSENAPKSKWEITSIVTYVKHTDAGDSLFSSIDALVEKKDEHFENGENLVYLEGCTLYHNNEDKSEFLKLVLRNKNTGVVEENLTLFPGNDYTDKYGVVHEKGHNWLAFGEEVKRQYNKAGYGFSSKGGLAQLFRTMQSYPFTIWVLYDGKYTNLYVTQAKYDAAVKRLAVDQKKGSPKKAEAKTDDKPPFEV